MNHDYEANGSKNHIKYKCCVHQPLIDGDDELEILDVVMVPELHIFTGIVNRLVRTLNARWDNGHNDKFYKWCDKNYIIYTGFHSKELQGNSCRMVLKKLNELHVCFMAYSQFNIYSGYSGGRFA